MKYKKYAKKQGIEIIEEPTTKSAKSKLAQLLAKTGKTVNKYGQPVLQKTGRIVKKGLSQSGRAIKTGAKKTGKWAGREVKNWSIRQGLETGVLNKKNYRYNPDKKTYVNQSEFKKGQTIFKQKRAEAEAKGWKWFIYNGKKYPVYKTKTKTTTNKTTTKQTTLAGTKDGQAFEMMKQVHKSKGHKWFYFRGKKYNI